MSTETTNKKIKIDNGTTFGRTYTDKAVDERLQGLVSTATFTPVQEKANNSLQKPKGLTKTELVGVGANGQENIEIGDNLTLANGKLSAIGGGVNGLESDAEGNLTANKNLEVDGKLTLKSLKNTVYDGGIVKQGFIDEYGLTKDQAKQLILPYAGQPTKGDYPHWGTMLSGSYREDYISLTGATGGFASRYEVSKRLRNHFIRLTTTGGTVVFAFNHHYKFEIESIQALVKLLNTIHVVANGKITINDTTKDVLAVGVEAGKLVAIMEDNSTIDLTEYAVSDIIGTPGSL